MTVRRSKTLRLYLENLEPGAYMLCENLLQCVFESFLTQVKTLENGKLYTNHIPFDNKTDGNSSCWSNVVTQYN